MGILVEEGNGNVLRMMNAFTAGLQSLNDKFNAYTSSVQEDIKFNGRTIYLTRRLNDLYDDTLRRIYIVTQSGIPVRYVFRSSESQTDFIYRTAETLSPYYVGRIGESGIEFDFVVYVPLGLVYDDEAFNATITRYIAVDKEYIIQTY